MATSLTLQGARFVTAANRLRSAALGEEREALGAAEQDALRSDVRLAVLALERFALIEGIGSAWARGEITDAAAALSEILGVKQPGRRTAARKLLVDSDEVLVALRRGEGYEDVHPQLVGEDAISPRWPAWRVVWPGQDDERGSA